jgi:hypothetical protein
MSQATAPTLAVMLSETSNSSLVMSDTIYFVPSIQS